MNTSRSQSEGIEIRATDTNGNQQCIAHCGFTIRPGSGFNVNVDVFDSALVAENLATVKESVNAFVTDALAKAAVAGMPVGE